MPSTRSSKRSSRSAKRPSALPPRSLMGRVKVPLNVNSNNNINTALNKILNSKITIILIYADWCGHCKTYEPYFNRAASVKGAPSTIKLNEQMVGNMNTAMNKKLPLSTPIEVDGYPTVIAVNNRGQKITELPIVREDELNTKMMTAIPEIMNEMPEEIGRQLNLIKNRQTPRTNVTSNTLRTVNNFATTPGVNISSRETPEDLSVYPTSVATESSVNLVTPPASGEDLEGPMTPKVPTISKQSGGLYGALVEASYQLAPAGILAGIYQGIRHRGRRTRRARRVSSRRNKN